MSDERRVAFRQAARSFADANLPCRPCAGLGFFCTDDPWTTTKCVECRGKGWLPRQLELFPDHLTEN
jgi:hypothetical protein